MAKISFVEINKVINNYKNFISWFLLVYVSAPGSIFSYGDQLVHQISPFFNFLLLC